MVVYRLFSFYFTFFAVCLTFVIGDQNQHISAPASCLEKVKAKLPDEYEVLQEKWRARLVPEEYDETNAALDKYVKTLSENSKHLYEDLNKSPGRTYLWPTLQENTLAENLSQQFQKLLTLTLAYGTKGTRYYKDPKILSAVKDGLEFMVTSRGYDGKKIYGNWWHWQIGAPEPFIDVLMIIKSELPLEKLEQYTKIISDYVPEPFHRLVGLPNQRDVLDLAAAGTEAATGAQKSAFAKIVLGLGILQKNNTKISLSLDAIKDTLKLVTQGKGFYQDGSFIEHRNIPYTGGLGSILVQGLGEILAIIKGSRFEMAPDLVKSFIETLERAFLPLIYRGEMIATVSGNSNTKSPPPTKVGYGSATMYYLLNVAKSTEYGTKLKESIKYWMRQNSNYYLTHVTNYNDLVMTFSLLNDPSIVGDNLPFVGTKMYASMDRFVQRTSDYMLGLSLYSKRISAFESGNRDNKRGWHTADGAIYLYNDDQVQFINSYWPTVDPYRFPGTTVDTRYLNDEHALYFTYLSEEKWVGGVANAHQAAIGMALNKARFQNNYINLSMDLKAKKSWFVLDGQIVALGAGITGTTMASIETIVENRLLNNLYSYEVLSKHGEIKSGSQEISVDWLLLKTDNQRSSIGYYFPNGEIVNVINETRTGTYKLLNDAVDSEIYTGNYLKFIIDHGKRPVDDKYAYVLLPGIKMSDLQDYVDSKPVKILENSADLQAVELVKEGYLGINFWRETGGEIAGIKSNKPLCLMRQTNGQQHTYVISDPTQSNNVVTIEIPEFSRLVSISEGIYYNVKDKAFVVDFRNTGGASKQFIVG